MFIWFQNAFFLFSFFSLSISCCVEYFASNNIARFPELSKTHDLASLSNLQPSIFAAALYHAPGFYIVTVCDFELLDYALCLVFTALANSGDCVMYRGATMVMQLVLNIEPIHRTFLDSLCVCQCSKSSNIIKSPPDSPCRLKLFSLKTSTTSHAGYYPYGKC